MQRCFLPTGNTCKTSDSSSATRTTPPAPPARFFFSRLVILTAAFARPYGGICEATAATLAHLLFPTAFVPTTLVAFPRRHRCRISSIGFFVDYLPDLPPTAASTFLSLWHECTRNYAAPLHRPPPPSPVPPGPGDSFRLHCCSSVNDFGATSEQGQPDGFVRPIVYISRTDFDNERQRTPLVPPNRYSVLAFVKTITAQPRADLIM